MKRQHIRKLGVAVVLLAGIAGWWVLSFNSRENGGAPSAFIPTRTIRVASFTPWTRISPPLRLLPIEFDEEKFTVHLDDTVSTTVDSQLLQRGISHLSRAE